MPYTKVVRPVKKNNTSKLPNFHAFNPVVSKLKSRVSAVPLSVIPRAIKHAPTRKYNKSKNSKAIQWKEINKQSMVFDVADVISVPASTPTSGKTCRYGHVGVSTANFVGNLLSIPHLGYMGNKALQASAPAYGATGAYGNAATAPYLETKYKILDCYQTTELSNTSLGQITLTAYKCEYRRDTANLSSYTSPLWLLGDGFYQRQTSIGSAVPVQGYNNSGVTTDSLSPYDSHKFCSFVRILKQTKIQMGPGQIEHFTIKRGSQMINMDHYVTDTSSITQYPTSIGPYDYSHRKGELFYLFKVTGQVTNDMTNPNLIGASTPKVDMITKTHYNFVCLNPALPTVTEITPVNYGTLTTNEYVDIESGTIVIDKTA